MQEINAVQSFAGGYYKTGYVGNNPERDSYVSQSQTAKESQENEAEATGKPAEESRKRSISGKELTEEEQQKVERLKQRDRKVRSHENAHAAAAGPYKRGGAQFSYKTGPDGKQYAVSGNVSIDMGSESSPEATIAKMKTIQRAAIAPQDPSAQDRSTYSAAVRREMSARQALREEEQLEQKKRRAETSGDSTNATHTLVMNQSSPLARADVTEPQETRTWDAQQSYNRQDISRSGHGQTARLDFQG